MIKREEFLQNLGSKIKEYRIKKGWSQKELAFQLDLSQQDIFRIEHGHVNTGIFKLYEIATALDISLVDLFAQ